MNVRSRQIEARLEIPMAIAAFLVIPLLLIEQSASSQVWLDVADTLNWVIWIAFFAEVAVMLSLVTSRWTWIREHPLELIVVLFTAPVLPGGMQALRALRLLRLVRLLLLAKRMRKLLTLGGLSHAALLGLIVVLAGGVAIRTLEPTEFASIWDGVWWALTTATTVGYGDLSPATGAGRIIAAFVMIVGVAFVALLTAALARYYVSEDGDRAEADILEALKGIEARLAEIERRI